MKALSSKISSYRRRIIALVSVVILVLILVSASIYFITRQPIQKSDDVSASAIDYGPPTQEQIDANKAIKQNTGNNDKDDPSKSSNPPPTITIARAMQPAAGQPVGIRTIIDKGSTSQECLVTLSMPGQAPLSKTVAIVSQPTYLSCASIDIPASEFSHSGTWKVDAQVMSDSLVVSNVASTTIEVKK